MYSLAWDKNFHRIKTLFMRQGVKFFSSENFGCMIQMAVYTVNVFTKEPQNVSSCFWAFWWKLNSPALLTFSRSHSDSRALHQRHTAHWSDSWHWSAHTSRSSDHCRRKWGTDGGCRSRGFDPDWRRIGHTHWNSTSGLPCSCRRSNTLGHRVRRYLQKLSGKRWLVLAMEPMQLHWVFVCVNCKYMCKLFINMTVYYNTGRGSIFITMSWHMVLFN